MDVAARLVEVMSGLSFDEYLRTEVFEPLGMVDTAFSVADDDLDRFAACYGRNSPQGARPRRRPGAQRLPEAAQAADGRWRAGRHDR